MRPEAPVPSVPRMASVDRAGSRSPRVSGPSRSSRSRGTLPRAWLWWWFWLTAPPEPPASARFAVRERARRGRLLSILLLGFLLLLLGALYQYLVVDSDHPAMVATLLFALAAAFVAAALNRVGFVRTAGFLMVALAELPLAGTLAATKDGRLDVLHLGAFYLIGGSLLVAASVLAPWSVFPVAALNSALAIALVRLLPQTPALRALLASNDGQQALLGPVVMQGILALVAYFWARSTVDALRRADRAEEVALLERRELERQAELEEGVRQLLAVHVQLANGDSNARAPMLRNPMLWQVGNSLNMLIARLGRYAQAEYVLRREREEAHRVAEAIQLARSGHAVVWPAPSGLPLDPVTEALRAGGVVSIPTRGSPSTPLAYAPSPAPPVSPADQADQDEESALPDWLRPGR